jgi:hypothetical protein
MNELPELPRAIMRKEDEPGHEKGLWQPTWNCFCCRDLGLVQSHLAAMVIKGFNAKSDKLPRCQNQGCSAGERYDGDALLGCIDYRFSTEICQKLDAIERNAWKETLQVQRQTLKARLHQLQEQQQKLIQQMQMPGTSARTEDDNREVAIRHEEIKNTDPQKLTAAASEYLGHDYWREGSS